MSAWWWLALAIVAEVIATLSLKASDGFTRWQPTIVVVIGYGVAFYAMAWSLKSLPVGVVYAVWSGVGIVLIALLSWVWFNQTLSLMNLLGITLILAGVVVLNLSTASIH